MCQFLEKLREELNLEPIKKDITKSPDEKDLFHLTIANYKSI